jgi:Tfp pilus assembly protein PilX
MGIESRIDACLKREGGFAVPTVLLLIVGVFSIAMAGALVSMSAQRGAIRDADTKAALAAAEAGANQALLRYNRYAPTPAASCVVSSSGSLGLAAPAASGWCSPVTGITNEGSFEYHTAPTPGRVEIVSTGESNGVTRRIEVAAESVSGQGIFSTATVKSRENISLNANAEIRANAATNGGMTLDSNAKLCGTGSIGVGQSISLTSNAQHYADTNCTGTGTTIQKPLTLPAVNQGDAATVNDNARFFSQDLRTGGSKVQWCAALPCPSGLIPRQLDLKQNSSVTLGGSIYSFCKLTMESNTAIYVAPGSRVTIFFDSPEACGLPPNSVQMKLSSNSRITATGGGAANAAFLFVGSDTVPTRIELNSNTQVAGACEQNFVIYAPRTDFSFDSNSTYCGAVAGKSIEMKSNAKLYIDSAAKDFVLPNTAPHYEQSSFIECGGPAGTPPDAGC